VANILILSPTDSDAATVAASSQVATLPATNLQTMAPKRKWRSSGLTEFLTFDFGAAGVAANGLALIGHNLTGAATIRVRGKATSDVTVTPTVDTGAVSAWPASGKPTVAYWPQYFSWLQWTNAATLRYWRLDIADAANPAGYVEAGRTMLGRYWQPTQDFDFGGTPLAFDTRDVQTVTDYGEIFTDRRQRSAARRTSLKISAGDKREVLDGIAEVQRLRGMWGDVACLLEPAATTDFHRFSMQGVFTTPQEHQIVQQFSNNAEMWTVNFPLREVI
jgi:hypothetical protein